MAVLRDKMELRAIDDCIKSKVNLAYAYVDLIALKFACNLLWVKCCVDCGTRRSKMPATTSLWSSDLICQFASNLHFTLAAGNLPL